MDEMNVIRVPRALEGLQPLVFDMAEIRQAQGRLGEVAMVNSIRAPELLSTFNLAYLSTCRYLNYLEYEFDAAKRRLAEVRAIFLIDVLPALLAEKGLSSSRSPLGSEDIRTAFLDRDPEYKKVQELVSNIKCYISMLETIRDGFENGYNSVKKLLGNSGSDSSWRPNPNLPQPAPLSSGVVPGLISTTPATPATSADGLDDYFGTTR